MVEDNFREESEDDLQINYGIVSVLPVEYDRVSEVSEVEEDFIPNEVINQKPLCYYVMNNGVVEEQQAVITPKHITYLTRLAHVLLSFYLYF